MNLGKQATSRLGAGCLGEAATWKSPDMDQMQKGWDQRGKDSGSELDSQGQPPVSWVRAPHPGVPSQVRARAFARRDWPVAWSLAHAHLKPQEPWVDKYPEERLLPLRPQQGALQPLWLSRAVLRALSASYHSRLPTSHGGESCHHTHLTDEGAASLPTLTAKSKAGPWG